MIYCYSGLGGGGGLGIGSPNVVESAGAVDDDVIAGGTSKKSADNVATNVEIGSEVSVELEATLLIISKRKTKIVARRKINDCDLEFAVFMEDSPCVMCILISGRWTHCLQNMRNSFQINKGFSIYREYLISTLR